MKYYYLRAWRYLVLLSLLLASGANFGSRLAIESSGSAYCFARAAYRAAFREAVRGDEGSRKANERLPEAVDRGAPKLLHFSARAETTRVRSVQQ